MHIRGIARYGVLAIGLSVTFLAFIAGGESGFSEYSIPKAAVLNVAALACLLCAVWPGKDFRVGAIDLCVAGGVLLAVLSAVTSGNPELSLAASGAAVSFGVLFWTSRSLVHAGLREHLILLIIASSVLAAVVALLDAYGLLQGIVAADSRPSGTFGNRNRIAHIVALGLPLLLLEALSARNRVRFVAFTIAAIPAVAALILSRCRGAWLSVLVVVPITLWLWSRSTGRAPLSPRRRVILPLAAVTAIALATLLPNDLEWREPRPYQRTLTTLVEARTGSGAGRLLQYRTTARMMLDHPFLGVGPGRWAIEYPRYSPPGDPNFDRARLLPISRFPQSDWLGLASERGIPAALCWFLLLAIAIAPCAKLIQREHSVPADQARMALLAGSVAIGACVVGVVDALVLTPGATFWVALALGASVAPLSRMGGARIPRAGWMAAVGAVLLVLVPACALSVRELMAVREYAASPGIATLKRGLEINPQDYRARVMLAHELVITQRCDEAAAYIDAAQAWLPTSRAVSKLRRKCAPPGTPTLPWKLIAGGTE